MTEVLYQDRRRILSSKINAPIVLTAHGSMQAKSDMAYKFTQEPSFLYFTGIDDQNWKLIFDTKSWHLVRPSVSTTQQIFDGSLSDDEAKQASGVTSVISPQDFKEMLKSLAHTHSRVATIGEDPMKKYYEFAQNPAQASLRRLLRSHFSEIVDCRDAVRKMRAIKSDEEIALMRKAIDVTIEAFAQVKNNLAHYSHEYQIEAYFNSAFRETGAQGHAYDPIVAAGAHACTLHYAKNQAALPSNGLVLIDIGAQYGGYAADITRTYALGEPTARESQVHKSVEAAHKKITSLIKPGLSFAAYHSQVDEIMKHALIELGLIKSEKDDASYRKYFPHAVGHGLGIDVHESLGGYDEFKPGMVLTVEPGIYIPEDGIGVRIEDDILVTASGNENLSADLPTSL